MVGHNVLTAVVRNLLYTYRGCMLGVPLPWICFLQLPIIGIICQSFFWRSYLLSHKLVHWKIYFWTNEWNVGCVEQEKLYYQEGMVD